MYAASVIRRKQGAMGQELKVDLSLPHSDKLGIVVVSAEPDAIRYERAEDGEDPWYARPWGHLGGAIYARGGRSFATRDEAIENARQAMLADGWHETREAAVAAGIKEFESDPRRKRRAVVTPRAFHVTEICDRHGPTSRFVTVLEGQVIDAGGNVLFEGFADECVEAQQRFRIPTQLNPTKVRRDSDEWESSLAKWLPHIQE
ncbi:MAG: hypothetical protein E6Q97_17555 [Desulfurellales bacterium]|nr:MAG: hypothetical protein E6Q97_17555 [Desulfurellales bacterium]